MGVSLAWDRGTVLVGGGATDRPGVTWDARVGRWRAPAWRYAELRPASDIDAVIPPLPAPGAVPVPALRPYQQAALQAWSAAGRRGVIALPTGAGKTRTAIAAIATTPVRTLILAPTNVLVAQWVAALEAAGCGPVGRYADGERVEHPITVATFASARVHMATLGNRFGLLVVDEVHHFGGGAGDEVLEQCAAWVRLGLTATPHEGERAARLDALIGPVVFRASVDALAGAWLAPLAVHTWRLDLTPEERTTYEADSNRFRAFFRGWSDAARQATWADFLRDAQRSEPGRAAVAAWRRTRALVAYPSAKRRALAELLDAAGQRRVLVFTADTDAAYAVAREHLVPVVTAAIGPAERTEILARFESGDWPVLVSARVLNEGVDVPAAETAIVVGGSQGSREYVQRVGRVLRPAAGKQAVVYDLVMRDTFEEFKAGTRREALRG